MKAQWEGMCSSTLSLTSVVDGVGVQRHAPAALPTGKELVPILQGAGWGPGAGLDRCGKFRSPPGFDPCTVWPIASRYTD